MLLSEIKSTKINYTLYVDIDGVLADFATAFKKAVGDIDQSKLTREERRDIKKKVIGPEFYYNLEMLPDAMKLWNYVKSLNPTLLTATGPDDQERIKDEKERWVDKYFNGVKVIVVDELADKAKYATSKSILIDDMPYAINPWIKKGGIGILHKSADDTIKRLKELGL